MDQPLDRSLDQCEHGRLTRRELLGALALLTAAASPPASAAAAPLGSAASFTDPDGLRVHLQDVKDEVGTGVLGDQDPE